MPSQIQALLPVLAMWVIVGILWVIKILIERQRNAKSAENKILVFKWPMAGYMTNEPLPIENIGGEEVVRYPRKGTSNTWPIHRLSDAAQVPVLWPLGKIHFVQATMQAIMFLGDDVEPLSNIRHIPPISARQLTGTIQGVTVAIKETLRAAEEDATGKKVEKHTNLWLYVLGGVNAALVILAIVLIVQNGTPKILQDILNGVNDLLSAKGLR